VVEYVTGIPHPQAVPEPTKPTEEAGRRVIVKSPMVGTFYRAPAPDAPPFVELGQEIDVGQVICIIEAMKLMNEIKSEVAGGVLEILVENGEAVEFGQPLFTVEPRGHS
jgi:acetyl-CoA carboxylase biotin carboxyl carrier protein